MILLARPRNLAYRLKEVNILVHDLSRLIFKLKPRLCELMGERSRRR